MRCPHCKQEHPEGIQFCPFTGGKINLPNICPQCGKPAESNWLHCGNCGRALAQAGEVPTLQEPQGSPLRTLGTTKTRKGFPNISWLIIIMGGTCSLLFLAAFIFIVFWNWSGAGGAVSLLGGSNAIPYTWTSKGPEGGNIHALVIDPLTPTTLYIGTFGHGVFKSTDGGLTWSAASAGLTFDHMLTIRVLAIDPETPTTLYAGTYGGIYKSLDGGDNWSALTDGLPTTSYSVSSISVSSLVIDPANSSTLYMGTSADGIFKSTDGGSSWSALKTNVRIDSNYITSLVIDPLTTTTLYAGTYEGLLKSTDGGDSWSVTNPDTISILSLVIDPTTPTTLYAGTGNSLQKSMDGGKSWNEAHAGLPDGNIHTLLIDPAMPSTLYAVVTQSSSTYFDFVKEPLGVFKSSDGGLNWNAINSGLTTEEVASLVIFPASPAGMYAGTLHGVFKSTDGGGNWSAINSGLAAVTITSLVADPAAATTLYAGAGENGVFKSTDGGDTWSMANNGLTAEYVSALVISPLTPTTLYAVGSRSDLSHSNNYSEDSRGVFKSTDGGESWSAASTGLTDRYISTLVIDPVTPTTLYVVTSLSGGIFKSTDGGSSWNAVNDDLPGDDTVTSLAIDPVTPTTLYLGTYNGILKSTDGGENWGAVNNGFPEDKSMIVKSLAIDPLTPTTLYAGLFANGVFKSTDGGDSWSRVNNDFGYTNISILTFNSGTQTILYAMGTSNEEFHYYAEDSLGIFKSMDGGESWSEIATGLTDIFVYALLADPETQTTLFLGTTRGVFRGANKNGN
jgi:photosystem II stability/assembly factor-like uncharacterized protein